MSILFTLKGEFHPHNHAVKSIILKNFKLLQNDSETGTIFSQPPLISFKRDKNIGNFLVRSSFQTYDQRAFGIERASQRGRQVKRDEIYFTHFIEFYPKELSLTVDRSN